MLRSKSQEFSEPGTLPIRALAREGTAKIGISDNEGTSEAVGVTRQKFRRRMHDDVGAEVKGV